MLSSVIVAGAFAVAAGADPNNYSDSVAMLCKTLQTCADLNHSPGAESLKDLSLRYYYSDPDGTGRELILENGSTLYDYDRFTIEITPHKSVYLYLVYLDSNGHLSELLSLDNKNDQPNYLSTPDRTLKLPATTWFTLDEHRGKETIYAIVSSKPREDIISLLQQTPTTIGSVITCQCGDPCVEPFVINHSRLDNRDQRSISLRWARKKPLSESSH